MTSSCMLETPKRSLSWAGSNSRCCHAGAFARDIDDDPRSHLLSCGIPKSGCIVSRLLDLILEGEEVVICRHGKAVARLAPAVHPKQSPFGAMRGEFQLPEGWDRPLSPEEADRFWEGKW